MFGGAAAIIIAAAAAKSSSSRRGARRSAVASRGRDAVLGALVPRETLYGAFTALIYRARSTLNRRA
jgi:hypothetical protein